VDEFLREAKEAYDHKLYSAAVVMSHSAVRFKLEGLLKKEGVPMKELAERAYQNGASIEVKELGKLSWIRNRIEHEGYLPRREEARWAVGTAERNLGALRGKGLLHRVLGWLRP
jgi:HEPN domain-containing protein